MLVFLNWKVEEEKNRNREEEEEEEFESSVSKLCHFFSFFNVGLNDKNKNDAPQLMSSTPVAPFSLFD